MNINFYKVHSLQSNSDEKAFQEGAATKRASTQRSSGIQLCSNPELTQKDIELVKESFILPETKDEYKAAILKFTGEKNPFQDKLPRQVKLALIVSGLYQFLSLPSAKVQRITTEERKRSGSLNASGPVDVINMSGRTERAGSTGTSGKARTLERATLAEGGQAKVSTLQKGGMVVKITHEKPQERRDPNRLRREEILLIREFLITSAVKSDSEISGPFRLDTGQVGFFSERLDNKKLPGDLYLLNWLDNIPRFRAEINKELAVLMVVGDMLEEMANLNEFNVIHKDIKDENMLFDKDGRVRLVDFGLASVVREAKISMQGTIEVGSFELLMKRISGIDMILDLTMAKKYGRKLHPSNQLKINKVTKQFYNWLTKDDVEGGILADLEQVISRGLKEGVKWEISPKTDIAGLGMTLSYLLQKTDRVTEFDDVVLEDFFCDYIEGQPEGIEDLDKSDAYDVIDCTKQIIFFCAPAFRARQFSDPKHREKLKSENTSALKPWVDIIGDMVHPDPSKRPEVSVIRQRILDIYAKSHDLNPNATVKLEARKPVIVENIKLQELRKTITEEVPVEEVPV